VPDGLFDATNRITEQPFCEELHGHFRERLFDLSDSKTQHSSNAKCKLRVKLDLQFTSSERDKFVVTAHPRFEASNPVGLCTTERLQDHD
jgi:hypothetical protein